MKHYNAEEKNKIVELILNKEKTVKELASESEDSPSVGTIARWKKEYLSQGPYVDDNNNDAIPSWSGYSYQGKVAILCVLEKINELNNLSELDGWAIQLEKVQDFIFFKDKEIVSLWQVKAMLSSVRYQSYVNAMDKLLEDKRRTGFLDAKCYLVAAVDITNWNDENNAYKDNIHLYMRDERAVTIKEVSNEIKKEIGDLINQIGITVDEEAAYLNLCYLIDKKVSEFHQAGKKDNYLISFTEIIKQIEETEAFEKRISELRIKESIYQNICEKIQGGISSYCEDCEKRENGSCDPGYCAINRNNELVGGVDVQNYMKSIRPEIEKDIDYTINHPEDYSDTICYSIRTAPAIAMQQENDIISVTCYNGKINVIPTMLDLSRGTERRLSKTLEAVEKNEWLKSNIGRKILVGNTQNVIFGTELTKFTNIRLNDLLKGEEVDNTKNIGVKYFTERIDEKASTVHNSIIVIDREQLINYFGEDDE